MSQPRRNRADGPSEVKADIVIPILQVKNYLAARNYYTKKLLFESAWDWGKPPTFGCVRLDKVEIFLCLANQGQPGTWLAIHVEDVDGYYRRIKSLGADVIRPPQDEEWGMREMLVRDPNRHVIRFGHGIPARHPKLEIERVQLDARIEKRLAALIADVARHNNVSVGEMLEETLLHSMEPLPGGGVASPHTTATHLLIQELRRKHGIDYDCHANYRFMEKNGPQGGARKTTRPKARSPRRKE